jgi:cysteinyl-tRNA synthetase
LYTALRNVERRNAADADPRYRQRFDEAMNDDFNTAEAIAVLFDVAREINKRRDTDAANAGNFAGLLAELGGVLGLLQDDPEVFLKSKPAPTAEASAAAVEPESLSADEVDMLIQQRLDARKEKNWSLADKIRDDLKARGVILEDAAGGTTWRRG